MSDTQFVNDLTHEDAKQALISHFSTRLALIENNISAGIRGRINSATVQKLHNYTKELSATASRFELATLSESLYFLSTFFSSLGEAEQLSDNQIKELDTLLRRLRDAQHKSSASSLENIDDDASRAILLLANEESGLSGDLNEECGKCDYQLIRLSSPNGLYERIRDDKPDAIVIDITFLPEITDEIPKIKSLLHQRNMQTPLIFIGRSDNVEQHLLALRSGANAYLALPAKSDYLAGKIVTLIKTQNLHFRVLIIEDDPAQADYAAAILRKAGMEVIALTKPLMAVRALNDFKPDLILMDLYMPDASGKELTTIIRENDDLVSTPIVYLSGEQDTDKQIDALSAGGDDFLSKPIRPHHLINTVSNRIRRSRAMRGERIVEQPKPKLDTATGLIDQTSFTKEVNRILKSNDSGDYEGLLHLQLETVKNDNSFSELPQRELIMADIANIISDNIHAEDLPARLEGNAFGILLVRNPNNAARSLSQLLEALIDSAHYGDKKNPIMLRAKIGIAAIDKDSSDAVHLISEAMFAANDSGIADSSYLSTDSEIRMAAEILKEQLLQSALDGSEFLIQHAPLQHRKLSSEFNLMQELVKVPDGRGYYQVHNLLARIKNETLLTGIDNYTLRHALEQIADSRYEGREINLVVPMSQHMLGNPEGALWLREELRKMQLVGTGLILAFRYSDVAGHLKNTKSVIKSLRQFGSKVCFSHFHGSPTHFKIAKALQPHYVAVSSLLLDKADTKTITIVGRNLDKLGIELCLFPPEDDRKVSPDWNRVAHLAPKGN